jgi:hypothetical protein
VIAAGLQFTQHQIVATEREFQCAMIICFVVMGDAGLYDIHLTAKLSGTITSILFHMNEKLQPVG